MKKIFKTVALATAITMGALTMTGCPNPVLPENDTEQDNNNPGTGGDDETPIETPQPRIFRLATSFNDASADLTPDSAYGGVTVYGHTWSNYIQYDMEDFVDGGIYEIEGVVGRDFLKIHGYNYQNPKQIHIRSKNVAVDITNAGAGTTVHVEMPLVPGPLPTSQPRPQAPFHSFNASSAVIAAGIGGTKTGYNVTGTKGLWVYYSAAGPKKLP